MIKDIEKENRLRRKFEKTRVLGAKAVLHQDPLDSPESFNSSPKPEVHTTDPDLKAKYREAYRSFVNAHREAVERLRKEGIGRLFPPDCFGPTLSFPSLAEGAPPS